MTPLCRHCHTKKASRPRGLCHVCEEKLMKPLVFSCPSLQARFWPKVKFTDSCWLWSASISGVGYGQISFRGKPATIHRLVWELYFGPVPIGKIVRHKCDVRHCCNPEHLEVGTYADNSMDMVNRGRSTKGRLHGSANQGERNGRHKLTAETVETIRQCYARGGITQVELGRKHGVSGAHICGIVKARFWKKVVSSLQEEVH